MGVVVKGKNYVTPPGGVHQAVCVDVIDLGLVESSFGGENKRRHKIKIIWQIEALHPETGKRFEIARKYTASLHEKSSLRKDLQSWRGRAFNAEELRGFDLDNILSVNCLLNLVHKTMDDGGVYANVEAIMPITKGMAKMEPVEYVRMRDREKEAGEDHEGEYQATDDDVPF